MPKFLLVSVVAVLAAAGSVGCAVREDPVVAFLGDSLTEGFGLPKADAYPALLARELGARGHPIRALNAGVGGDTVAHGRARLAGVLQRRPDVLVIALGVNDALRGTSIEEAGRDLRLIVADARAQGMRVILVGVQVPPSLATAHTRRFALMYERLAADERVVFVPDLLAGAAGDPSRMFSDALHPNAAGQRQLAANVRPALESVLTEVAAAARTGASDGTKAGR